MGRGFEKEYKPDPARAEKYQSIFARYKKLGSFTEKELL
jgi:L-ribulokinase